MGSFAAMLLPAHFPSVLQLGSEAIPVSASAIKFGMRPYATDSTRIEMKPPCAGWALTSIPGRTSSTAQLRNWNTLAKTVLYEQVCSFTGLNGARF